jgi:nucleoside-diphosphate kinase
MNFTAGFEKLKGELMVERTAIILKPDCLQRGIAGEIISRFEKKGLKLIAMKLMLIPKENAEYHYAEHIGKAFYGELVEFITSSPSIVMVVAGDNAIKFARKMAGATKADECIPGTIRGDYVMQTGKNIIHTSDSPESAEREIGNFFSKDEIILYSRDIDAWI